MTQNFIASNRLKFTEIVGQPTDEKVVEERRRNGGNEKQSASRFEPPQASAHDWDDPDWTLLDDRRGELPEFPIEVFTVPWREWLRRAAPRAGARPEHVAVPLLGVGSRLIGRAAGARGGA